LNFCEKEKIDEVSKAVTSGRAACQEFDLIYRCNGRRSPLNAHWQTTLTRLQVAERVRLQMSK
jgi:hypothetical protein